MRKGSAATALTAFGAAALLAASMTAASAGDDGYGYRDHRGPGPVLGFLGQVATGALTIATAPLQLLGAGAHGFGYERGHDRYYDEGAYAPTPEIARDYYGSGARFYGPPPRYARRDEY